MTKESMLEIIEEYCTVKNGKKTLRCADASKIAEKLKISISEVGKLCHEYDIRISSCQLGCF